MENSEKQNSLIWIDGEFNGLNFETNTILELAVVVTDSDLNLLDEGIEVIIHQPDEILDNMDEWCTEHFAESGLTEKSRNSTISMEEGERMIMDYLAKHTEKGKSPLCGNSVGEDKRLIYKHMKNLYSHLHYRVVDVSTIKELARRWKPEVLDKFEKKMAHRAMDDILESIEELKVYKESFLDI